MLTIFEFIFLKGLLIVGQSEWKGQDVFKTSRSWGHSSLGEVLAAQGLGPKFTPPAST